MKISAREAALRLLDRRMYTEKELRRKLKEKEYPDEEIDEVLVSLKEYRFIDDLYYAKMYIESSMQKKKGELRIRRELFQKGVGKDEIDKAYFEKKDEVDVKEFEMDEAFKLAEKIYSKDAPIDRETKEKTLAKIGRRLATKGYSPDVIYGTLAKLKGRN